MEQTIVRMCVPLSDTQRLTLRSDDGNNARFDKEQHRIAREQSKAEEWEAAKLLFKQRPRADYKRLLSQL